MLSFLVSQLMQLVPDLKKNSDDSYSRIAADAFPGMSVLQTAELLEQLSLKVIAAARPFTYLSDPVGATATEFITQTEQDRTTLNHMVAAALRALNHSVSEPVLDRLADNPDLTLAQLHTRHMSRFPTEVAAVVDKHNGTILEAGQGGIAVLVGDTEQPPEAVMTLVAGTGSSARESA